MSSTRASSRPSVSGWSGTIILLFAFALCIAVSASAQTNAPAALAPQPLITQPIDESQLTTLTGNTHPLARPEFDLGTAPASLPMQRMLLVLKRSPEQELALRTLLDNQQDKHSPSYHQWLTPDQFGKQFGPTDQDMATITAWLQSHGFQVGSTHGRTALEFSGSASQVQEAFHTTIHKYLVNGQQHWANASDPSIPTALTPAVAGVASMNDFRPKPMNVPAGEFTRDKKTGRIYSAKPDITVPTGCIENNENQYACSYGLGPYDFATIYNELPLWNAGITGAGVTIAIVGETDIELSDVQAFRSFFGLPANDPNFIWNGPDPGIQSDESEADIDVQWSGGVAPGATIDFVISQSTETTAGVDLSAVFIVDQNLAPIMSESYGECELGLGTAGNQFYSTLWQQASAQGITVFISAGDAGSAGCDNFDAQSPAPAQYGLQVSGYASTPYNVAVGGTDFNDFSNPATYWSTTNNPTTQESALSYIPETTWNDSCTNAIFATIGYSSNAETNCNNPKLEPYFVVPAGGSGGSSACTTPNGNTPASCAGGYARPSWQTGVGSFSPDGHRDIPDVSLFASNGFVGQAYIICQADQNGACPNSFLGFGGTSVSSPAFAGIMALINQQTGERQGNANYVFYKLAQKSGASCTSSGSEASSCIFNDVTVGTNAGPCAKGSPNCVTNTSTDQYGVMSGYNAGAGYDLATGLGTVNANNLVNQWNTVATLASATTLTATGSTSLTHGQAFQFSVTVKPESGTGATPTGTISLSGPATQFQTSQGVAGFNLSGGTVSGSTDLLPGGSYQLTAHYAGDANYAASDSGPVNVNVAKENSQPQAFLVTFNSQNQIVSSNTNTAVYGSPYILRVNVENSSGQMCNPVSTSNATGCPSGNVVMTDNGSSLDAGTYALNSYGYFEDWSVQLPGGTNNVKAAYAGDNSFDASSATNAITITPAPTTTGNLYAGAVVLGEPAFLSTTVETESVGAAPTGTVTFTVNGSPLAGQLSLQGLAGTPTIPASLTASLSNVIFKTVGLFPVVASYSGDGNYAPSSSSTNVVVTGPSTNTLTANPINPQPGASVTLTAIIDTTVKSPAPSGQVIFYHGQEVAIPGNVSYTQTTDASGNAELQATLSYIPQVISDGVEAYYYDDPYFNQGFSNAVTIVTAGNDFAIYTSVNGPITVAGPGQDGFEGINIVGESAYAGTINFTPSSCSGLPALATCSFSPASVTGNGNTQLTIQTTAPTAQAQKATHSMAHIWTTLTPGFLIGAFLLFAPSKRKRIPILLGLLVLALLITLPSCGGGGGEGGGGNGKGGTPSGTYNVTVTATSGSFTHTVTFQMLVQ